MRVYAEYWTFSNLNNDNDFCLNEQFFSLLQKIENHPKCFSGYNKPIYAAISNTLTIEITFSKEGK